MNRNATAALALLLGSAAMVGIWRFGWNGPTYARVLSSTPVVVTEPRYADVVEAVPVMADAAGGVKAGGWNVAYRQGSRLLHTRWPSEPGDQIQVGEQHRVIGYDVAWCWRERRGVVRLGRKPGNQLPVEHGAVMMARRPFPLEG